MKATVLTFFLILSVIVNVCAQKANVTISEPTYVKGRTGTKLILGEKDGKIFVVSQYGNNEKNPTLHVETYDAKSLKQSASNKVELSNTESTKSDLEAVTLEDQLYIWYSQRYRSKETKDLVHQAVLTPAGDGMPKTQKELDYYLNISNGMGGNSIIPTVFYQLSQDSTKLIIYNKQDGKEVSKEYKDQTVLNVSIYDFQLKQLIKKEIIIDVEYTYFRIIDLDCDSELNIIMVSGINDYKSKFSKKRGIDGEYNSIIGIYHIRKNEKKCREVLITKKDHNLRNLSMIIDNDRNILLVGYYSIYRSTSRMEGTTEFGTYFVKLSGKDMSILVEKMETFSSNIFKDIVDSKGQFSFSSIDLIDAKITSSGMISLMSETYGNEASGAIKLEITRVIFLHRFSPDGEILWDMALPRGYKQTSSNNTSFSHKLFNDKLFLFYYDAPANLTKVGIKNMAFTTSIESSNFVMIIIDESGKWKKQNLTPTLKGVKPFKLDDTYNGLDGSLIFISGDREHEKLVKISVTN